AFGPLALWSSAGRRETPLRLRVGEATLALRLAYAAGEAVQVTLGDERHEVEVLADDGVGARFAIDGAEGSVQLSGDGRSGWAQVEGVCEAFEDLSDAPPRGRDGGGDGAIVSRMHGALVQLAVQPGQRVAKGEFVLAIEAMKMEHRIVAPLAGTVAELGAAVGTQVAPGRLLLRIEPDAA
ncbi:biotin/lipoyl-containing protein, partial [Plasticicumulans sp.]|uniref:acetyl-CoA carboxylase biotin carboxyl carrier protein subunit n=1 Tax=Plasticicumulans sp. TaxID=2307179 RepID=UPI0032203713